MCVTGPTHNLTALVIQTSDVVNEADYSVLACNKFGITFEKLNAKPGKQNVMSTGAGKPHFCIHGVTPQFRDGRGIQDSAFKFGEDERRLQARHPCSTAPPTHRLRNAA